MSTSSDIDEKTVCFGDVTIQEYPLKIGDNPACGIGAPIQLGWEPTSTTTHDLDVYEYVRKEERCTCRKDLVISSDERARMLYKVGYSAEDIVRAAFEVETVKKLRMETLQNQGNDRMSMLLMLRAGKVPALPGGPVFLKKAKLVPREIFESTSRAIRSMAQPKQKTSFAKMA